MSASLFLTVPLGVVLLLPAAAGLTAGLRGRAGTLRRADTLGIHGPAARSSEEAFALANRVAAPVALAAAAIFALGAVLVIALRLPVLATLVIFMVALIGGVALLIAAGTLGERSAATVPKPATRPAACDGCACGSDGCAGLAKAGLTKQD